MRRLRLIQITGNTSTLASSPRLVDFLVNDRSLNKHNYSLVNTELSIKF